MIVTEYFRTRSDGVVLVRTYSDKGKMIEREGDLYEEAIDPEVEGRTYTETDQDVVGEEATEADYVAALRTLGVNVDEQTKTANRNKAHPRANGADI